MPSSQYDSLSRQLAGDTGSRRSEHNRPSHDAASRFDRIRKLFMERRVSRRTAVAQGGVGLVASALGTRGLASASAQDGTPEATPTVDPNDPHPSADDVPDDLPFLFVQPFESGTWAPKEGEDDVYTLTLTGAAAQTVYFSDRPGRIVGLAPTDLFLEGLGFTPDNPPNAALVSSNESGEQEILVIELFDPVYDDEAGTLSYDALVLADYAGPGLAHLAVQQTDFDHPETFGEGSLFIDDCPDGAVSCGVIGSTEEIGDLPGTIGRCWSWLPPGCDFCNQDWTGSYYGQRCAEAYPDQCHYDSQGWNCYAAPKWQFGI